MICESCIHNAVCKYGENRSNGLFCTGKKCKQYQSTADVVPKREVEELSGKYEDLKLKYADLQKDKDELIAWGDDKKSEVVREIFDDAHNMLSKMLRVADDSLVKAVITNNEEAKFVSAGTKELLKCVITCFSELKKKYTEVKT